MLTSHEIDIAYQILLGREADPQGRVHYEQLAEGGLDLRALSENIMASEEFRRRAVVGTRQTVKMGRALVVVDPNEPEFGRAIAADGSWEPHIMEILERHLRPGDTFVDIGANVGVMAFTAAALVGPRGRVLGFEPHPENIGNFLAGVAANGFGNVTLHGFALSNEQSIFSLIGSSNSYLMPERQTVFQTVSLAGDVVLANEPRIDFIKMDIEGHEPHALTGLDHTLRKHRPFVLCEFNPRCLRDHLGSEIDQFAEQLFELTKSIDAIEHNGNPITILSAEALVELWHEKNAEAVRTNFLPDGMLHFDLLFRVS